MSRFNPTSGQVKAYREETGIGINEAVVILKKQNMLRALRRPGIPSTQVLQEILIGLLEDDVAGAPVIEYGD